MHRPGQDPGPGTRARARRSSTSSRSRSTARRTRRRTSARPRARRRRRATTSSRPTTPRTSSTRARATRHGRPQEQIAANEGGKPMGAGANYHYNHRNALIEAARLGKAKQPINGALLLEAFGNHFLTDSFSSGHLRTPRQTLAEEWHAKVPMFFTNFKMFMAERIAKYINDHNWPRRADRGHADVQGRGRVPGRLDADDRGDAARQADAADHVRRHRVRGAARLRQRDGRRRRRRGQAGEAVR